MKIGSSLVLVAVGLLGVAGYLYLVERNAGSSPIGMKFEDPQSLKQLEAGVENRLALTITNPTRNIARIVGNNAC